MTGYGLAQTTYFLPSPGLGLFPLIVSMEEDYGAGIPSPITPRTLSSRQEDEVSLSICRTALFVCGAVTDVPVPDNGVVRTATALWFNPVRQLSSAQPLSHFCLCWVVTARENGKGFLLPLFLPSALLSVFRKQETTNATDKKIRTSKDHEAISLTKKKGRWSCVNVSCFLHSVKYWDGRKDFSELLHSNKIALAKLLRSGAGCWWILLAEKIWQKLVPGLFFQSRLCWQCSAISYRAKAALSNLVSGSIQLHRGGGI